MWCIVNDMALSPIAAGKGVLTVRWKQGVTRTADLDFTNVMAFEGIPQRLPIKEAVGIADFVETDTRNKRRKLLDGFWFD